MIPTGVFAVFLCTRSDFPRGRELDDWFGYRFFEVVRSIPRSIPVQYLTIGFPAPLPSYASKVGAILSHTQAPAPPTHTTHRHTHTHKCQFRSIGHVGCLFRKCPPFNTPRYPPVQYLPFNTPVQYPIEQKLPHIHREPEVLTHTHITKFD